jgi:hypothetical protein
MRRFAYFAAAALALVLASAATASGPWLGVVNGGSGVTDATESLSYVATTHGATTTVAAVRQTDERVLATTTVPGRWGVPLVTMNGAVGGLSTNGRVLVLAQPYDGNGYLQKQTAFTVLGTKPLAVRTTVKLKGDFGFDTLSPDGRTLYLIEHASERDIMKYRVRAYDLSANRLLTRVIADKRQAGWLMSGMPVARAATNDGRWVYTLYSAGNNYPFVHALDTKMRTAVCVGLPWSWSTAGREIQNAQLVVDGRKLVIAGDLGKGSRFDLDTKTFKVVKFSG